MGHYLFEEGRRWFGDMAIWGHGKMTIGFGTCLGLSKEETDGWSWGSRVDPLPCF